MVLFKGNNLNELHNLIMKGKFNIINDISNDAKHLIKNLLEFNLIKEFLYKILEIILV